MNEMHQLRQQHQQQQQFCLRWNNHISTLVAVFDNLLESESLVDVTLFAEGRLLRAHKVVLSACSPYFQTLFAQTSDKHPIVILKDVAYIHLKALLDYMYRGEVNVAQDELAPLIKTAESLKIKGLADGTKEEELRRSHRIPPAIPALEAKPIIRPRHDLTSSSASSSVLSAALTMPPSLSLSTPLSLPNIPNLSSLPTNLSTTLASTLSSSLANAHSFRSDSFMHPADMRRPGLESPLAKRRRKNRRPSGDYNDSGDSDCRSSGSPGDGVQNLQLPRIPATITPVAHQPRDLSTHAGIPPINLHISQNNHVRDPTPTHPSRSRTPISHLGPINLQSPYTNHNSHKVQEHPEDLKRSFRDHYPRTSRSPSTARHNSSEECNRSNGSPSSDHMSIGKHSLDRSSLERNSLDRNSRDRNSEERSYNEKSPVDKLCHSSPIPKQFRDERGIDARDIKKDTSEINSMEYSTYSMDRNPLLDRSLLEKISLDQSLIDKTLLDKAILDKIAQDKAFVEKMALDRTLLDKISFDKSMMEKLSQEKFLMERLANERSIMERINQDKSLLERTLSERSPSDRSFERTPSSGNSGSSLPSLPRPSPKENDVDATPTKSDMMTQRPDDEASPDTIHSDEEDYRENNEERSPDDATPGPSTSSRPHSEEAPPTPNYLQHWSNYPEVSSADEGSFGGDNSNPGFWKTSFKTGLLSPYLGSTLGPLSHPPHHHGLSNAFPGLYSTSPSHWGGRGSPPPSLSLRSNECSRCGRLYKTRKGLKHHIKNECGVEPRFQCSSCDWKFKQKAHLLRHMARKHTVS